MLLRKGSQCFIGPLLTPFDRSYKCNYSQKKMGVIVNNCTKERICIISVIIITCEVCH